MTRNSANLGPRFWYRRFGPAAIPPYSPVSTMDGSQEHLEQRSNPDGNLYPSGPFRWFGNIFKREK
jgi:hypothetical protein